MKNYLPAFLVLVALAGCGSSPDPSYFSLASVAGTALPETATVVKIRRPSLAGYLDRPEFVQQTGDFQISIQDMQRWAEPTDTMFARVMAEDLQQRLPHSHVVIEDRTSVENPRFTVDITIDHFNQVANGDVLLEGEMSLWDHSTQKPEEFIPIKFTTGSSSTPASVSAGLSTLVGHAADRLAEAVRNDVEATSR